MKPTFQDIIAKLAAFWSSHGCNILQGYDLEMGAGTFNPGTFLRAIGSKPFRCAYLEPSRRPTDGRYAQNPNRLQHFFQYQVILKPSPLDIQNLYLESLKAIGFHLNNHDVRFVHDDWESPTLGAWGLGWEVWIDGMEISQFTYFQAIGGIPTRPVTGEITYGLERLAMYLQGVDSVYDLKWNESITYGDIYRQSEIEFSHYNFEYANTNMWLQHFNDYEKEALSLIEQRLSFPAYDFVIKASHAFNMLDARSAISVSQRAHYIARIRNLAKSVANIYFETTESTSNSIEEEQKISIPNCFIPDSSHKPQDYVLEIGSEELPHTFIPIGMQNLHKMVDKLLCDADFAFDSIEVYGSPRRLSLHIRNLHPFSKSKIIEKKGPPLSSAFDAAGNLTAAGLGFLQSVAIDPCSLEDIRSGHKEISIQSIKNSDYLYVKKQAEIANIYEYLAKHIPEVVRTIEFPKKMRWSDQELTYARPLLWILSLYGETPIVFSIASITASNVSFGHTQRKPGSFVIKKAESYKETLRKHYVMVDPEERRFVIQEKLRLFESQTSLTVSHENRVLRDVINLTEWPEPIMAQFDVKYLQAPKEVLSLEMIEHQKYFPLIDASGNLSSHFVIVADNAPSDQIRLGNIKAITPRLADGLFLYTSDISVPLEKLQSKLQLMTYQANLGSLYDKTKRIESFATLVAAYLPPLEKQALSDAALLCKIDLATELVFEFPELQGYIGKLYAEHIGYSDPIAQAILQHWLPRSEEDQLPDGPLAIAISLADKLDNLLATFAFGTPPTASSDPLALKRQVFGIIKTLILHKISLPLDELCTRCAKIFLEQFPLLNPNKDLIADLLRFFEARLQSVFQSFGFTKDCIKASLSTGLHDVYDMYLRVQALDAFRKEKDFDKLLEVFKRAKGQLPTDFEHSIDAALCTTSIEKDLLSATQAVQTVLTKAIKDKDYHEAYKQIASLHLPLAKLFDNLRILDENIAIRNNRLALIKELFSLCNQLLDFSLLQK